LMAITVRPPSPIWAIAVPGRNRRSRPTFGWTAPAGMGSFSAAEKNHAPGQTD
jgi:hypothetical protein